MNKDNFELRCPKCGILQINRLQSAPKQIYCLSCSKISQRDEWMANSFVEENSNNWERVRWVSVHVTGGSAWAKRFGSDIAKSFLSHGYLVHEFISRHISSLSDFNEASRILSGADGSVIIGGRASASAEVIFTTNLLSNSQLMLQETLNNTGRTVIVTTENFSLLDTFNPFSIGVQSILRKYSKSSTTWKDQAKQNVVPDQIGSFGIRRTRMFFVKEADEWTPAFVQRVAREVHGYRQFYQSVVTPAQFEIINEANAKLIERLSKKLVHWDELNWRQVEELVAELFSGFGFAIELHSGTKDGGVDIVAIRNNNNFKPDQMLVQVKHWRGPIGLDVVKLLHGEVVRRGSTRGVIATTSSFTRGAKEFLEKYRWQLEGKDHTDLLNWVDQYMARKTGRLQ